MESQDWQAVQRKTESESESERDRKGEWEGEQMSEPQIICMQLHHFSFAAFNYFCRSGKVQLSWTNDPANVLISISLFLSLTNSLSFVLVLVIVLVFVPYSSHSSFSFSLIKFMRFIVAAAAAAAVVRSIFFLECMNLLICGASMNIKQYVFQEFARAL